MDNHTPMTLTEKVIARAANVEMVRPGEEVWAAADRMLMNDSSGPRRIAGLIDELGGLRDKGKAVLVSDHFAPAANLRQAEILKINRDWAEVQGLPHFYEYQGILHNIVLENWLALPGMLIVGADSHSVTAGAAGAVSVAVGSTELATILATGEIWLQTPKSIRIEITGSLSPWVSLRDITMQILQDLKSDFALYRAVEFGGSFIEGLEIEDRLVLSNQGIEMGAKNAVVEPTDLLLQQISESGIQESFIPVYPDLDAEYLFTHRLDAAGIGPLVSGPHQIDLITPVKSLPTTKIDQAWIGSCVGGRYADLQAAAQVLAGRQVRVPMVVTPATMEIYKRCAADGTLRTLTEAGTVIHPPGCGACAGLHSGVIAGGETIIATATRNFKGRMGSREAEIFLGSAYTTAASAVAGEIVDPRTVVMEGQR